jgi:hypothetical protein
VKLNAKAAVVDALLAQVGLVPFFNSCLRAALDLCARGHDIDDRSDMRFSRPLEKHKTI